MDDKNPVNKIKHGLLSLAGATGAKNHQKAEQISGKHEITRLKSAVDSLVVEIDELKKKFSDVETAITLVAENTVGLEDIISKIETHQSDILASNELLSKKLNQLAERITKIEIVVESLKKTAETSEKMMIEFVNWAELEKEKMKIT